MARTQWYTYVNTALWRCERWWVQGQPELHSDNLSPSRWNHRWKDVFQTSLPAAPLFYMILLRPNVFCFFLFFSISPSCPGQTHYVAEVDLKCVMLLPPSSKYWYCILEPLNLAYAVLGLKLRTLGLHGKHSTSWATSQLFGHCVCHWYLILSKNIQRRRHTLSH